MPALRSRLKGRISIGERGGILVELERLIDECGKAQRNRFDWICHDAGAFWRSTVDAVVDIVKG